VQWDDIRLEPFCLHQIAALILQKDTYHVSELVVTSYLKENGEKIFQKKWGKGTLREVIYAIAATERTKLFEKTSNSTSVHTGKELP
jgi:hypothetical protein